MDGKKIQMEISCENVKIQFTYILNFMYNYLQLIIILSEYNYYF